MTYGTSKIIGGASERRHLPSTLLKVYAKAKDLGFFEVLAITLSSASVYQHT
jgi:hypothetical protein